jgi:N6-adenosine-specific RNA methylase IME4
VFGNPRTPVARSPGRGISVRDASELVGSSRLPIKNGALGFHPLADLFPLIEGADFAELVADVKSHGIREPIWLCDGKILDGRNRYRAAQAAGVECQTRPYDGSDPLAFVVSANLMRRHLNESQRAMIADTLAPLPRGANQHAHICAPSQEHVARLFDVSRRNVQHARKVRSADSSVADMVHSGTINLNEGRKLIALPDDARKGAIAAVASGTDVRTAVRAAKKEDYNARIEAAKPEPLEGTYRIIYSDPPWTYHLNQSTGIAEDHYDCLTDKQLCEYRPGDGKRTVKELADKNAVLFMWTTAPMLEHCFSIIKAWGFEYKSFFVWDKVRHNVGYYNSVRAELLLICTRGSCTPDTGKLIDSVQSIERSARQFRETKRVLRDYRKPL